MINEEKTLKFLSYIKTPLSIDSVRMLYNAHNIKYERCELFNDFIQSLLCLVFDTYMGDKIGKNVLTEEQKINHFRWCWNKNLENFKNEGIDFKHTNQIYRYYLNFMLEFYYSVKEKEDNENIIINIKKIWGTIFSFGSVKTHSDVDAFLEIYKLMEKSL